jgi:hypothetical protein
LEEVLAAHPFLLDKGAAACDCPRP